jgi:adenine deaminase
MDKKTIKTLLGVVKGTIPPDTIIINGKIINVFTNSIDEGQVIIIKDGFIASVEEKALASSYKPASTIDAGGLYLCPGFIDAHTHIDGTYSFSQFVPYSIRGGTTTIVTETSATACAAGMRGIRALMDGMKGYPVRSFFLAPPLTPPFPKMESSLGLSLKEFSAMLKRENVVGIGEAYWTRIVDGERQILDQVSAALALNKRLDGHAAGARGKKLIEYVLTGITSCHESTTVDEVMEKLRHGLYIMIREGSIRQELPELAKLKNLNIDTRRIILVSDFFDAVMLHENGYLDFIGRKAIKYGFTPIETIKMMTINPADYYGLRYLGAIAPLRHADMLFLNNLENISIEKVMANGKIVYESGKLVR